MRNILKKTLGRTSEDQKGFTLIELLVVVGIIVALAAVIVPLVIQFAGEGETGANAAESATVQSAMDTVMTQNTALSVTARGTAAVVAAADDPTGASDPMSNYIRDLPTTCLYTWIASGLVTQASCP